MPTNQTIFSILFICTSSLITAQSLDLNTPENDTPGTGHLNRMHYQAVNLLPNYEANVEDENQGYEYEGNEDAKLNVTINPKMSGSAVYDVLPVDPVPLPPIDTELPVGAINYSTSISPTGAYSINIPIHIPKGTNGMEPPVSLVYNSQGNMNGIAGAGWGIQGTSTIYRSSKTLYFDHKVTGVNFSYSDALHIDGTRLVRDNANQNWQENETNTYHPETGNDMRVISHGITSPGSAEWFEVQTKSGLIHEYGRTENSRIADSFGKVYSWHLSKTTDQFGNYIIYSYKTENNQILLEEILYTGGNGFDPYNRIVFGYDERQDQQKIYKNGVEVFNKLILREVISFSKGTMVRKLTLNYQIDSEGNHPFFKRSFLKSIDEYGYGLTQINSIIFQYGHDSEINDICSTSETTCFEMDETVLNMNNWNWWPNSHYRTGDFNGDGFTDVIGYEWQLQTDGSVVYTAISLYLNNQAGVFELAFTSTDLPAGFQLDPEIYYGLEVPDGFSPLFISNTPDYRINSQIMDLNGDGMQDLVIKHSSGGSTYYTPWISTGNGFVKMENNANVLQDVHEWSMTFCDLNGDGVTEMLAVNHSYPDQQFVKFHVFDRGDGQSYTQMPSHYPSGPADRINPRLIAVDMDGDGADEILNWKGSSMEMQIIEFIFGNQYIDEQGVFHVENAIEFEFKGLDIEFAPDMHIFPTDLNGDGRADLLIGNPNNGNWHTYLNRHSRNTDNFGSSFIEIDPPANLADLDDDDITKAWVVADLDADGAAEIVFISSYVEIFSLKGESWENRKFQHNMASNILLDYSSDNTNPFSYYNFGDVDGDGLLELLVQPDAEFGYLFAYQLYSSPEQNLINSFRNSFGHVTNINYKPLTHSQVYSETVNEFVLPYKKQVSSQIVVESVESINNIGEISKMTYDYQDALYHTLGKGMLGFSVLRNFDHTTEIFNEKHQSIDTEFGAIIPTYSKSYRMIEFEGEVIEQLIGEKTMSYDFVELQFRNAIYGSQTLRYRIDHTNFFTKSFVTGEENTTVNVYDTHGNITSTSEASQADLDETTTTYEPYGQIDGWWISSLPTSKTVTTTRLGELPLIINEDYDYYWSTGAIKSITSKPNTDSWSKNEFEYNSKGLREVTTISGMGVETITEEFVHTPDGRNIQESTNGIGLVTTYTHSDLWGTVKTATDEFGRQKVTEFDPFGKVKKEADFLERWHSFEHVWADNANGQFTSCDNLDDVVFKTIVSSYNDRIKTTSFNRLGKPRLIEETAQFGILKKAICYDELGRVAIEDIPHFEDDLTVNTIETTYDMHNRVAHVGLSSKSTDYLYELINNEYKTTAESNFAGIKTTFTDFSGALVKNSDPGGYLEYKYFSGGLTKNVKYNNEIIIEHTYDEYGRKTSIDDVNAGIFTYEYDSYDRLIFEKDDENNETSTTYNNLGQVDFKSVETPESNGLYDYEYYTSGAQIHKLKKVTAPSGCSTEYQYNENDQMISVIENIDETDYEKNFEYDDFGRLIRKEYPGESAFAIRYVYDEKGYLEKITNDLGDIVIWEIGTNGINSQGQMVKYHLGNGLTVQQQFDGDNFPDQVTASNSSETLFIFDYSFNGITGNLMNRTLGSIPEHFAYDQDGLILNRLSGMGSSESEIEEVVEYNTDGNIATKEGVGEYFYDPEKKNAVAKIDFEGGVDENELSEIVGIQSITYNHFNSASAIVNMDDQLRVNLEYGPDDQRRLAKYWDDSGAQEELIKTRVYAGSYEKQINADLSEIEIHYISAGGQLVAMYVIEDGVGAYYYPHLDHLGSIIHVTDETGTITYTQSFDAWGRTRNADDHSYSNIAPRPDWLWRGYTGHEHLDEFGLINMNGRLYDPVVGQMLSLDNYIQSPDFTQSYNRYSYVWNNPLKYTDPSGEFLVLDSWINGFVHGFFSKGSNRFQNAWNTANTWAANDAKIWGGLFASDPNKTTGGRIWEVISRFTWQAPQTLGGFVTSHSYNTFGFGGGVESVNYAYGATVVKTKNEGWGAIAQGSYIVGDNSIEADANNSLFQHEYGHYLQSQSMGNAYYARVGIPSALSTGDHEFHPVEQDANRRAFIYFNSNVDGFYKSEQEYIQEFTSGEANKGWDFRRNPVVSRDQYTSVSAYTDFNNPSNMLALDKLAVRAKWYDHIHWVVPVVGPIVVGWINANNYND